MRFRFVGRKAFRIGKAARVTVSKTGIGGSIGSRAMRYTLHSSGRRTTSVGVPGGPVLRWRSTKGGGARRGKSGGGIGLGTVLSVLSLLPAKPVAKKRGSFLASFLAALVGCTGLFVAVLGVGLLVPSCQPRVRQVMIANH